MHTSSSQRCVYVISYGYESPLGHFSPRVDTRSKCSGRKSAGLEYTYTHESSKSSAKRGTLMENRFHRSATRSLARIYTPFAQAPFRRYYPRLRATGETATSPDLSEAYRLAGVSHFHFECDEYERENLRSSASRSDDGVDFSALRKIVRDLRRRRISLFIVRKCKRKRRKKRFVRLKRSCIIIPTVARVRYHFFPLPSSSSSPPFSDTRSFSKA